MPPNRRIPCLGVPLFDAHYRGRFLLPLVNNFWFQWQEDPMKNVLQQQNAQHVLLAHAQSNVSPTQVTSRHLEETPVAIQTRRVDHWLWDQSPLASLHSHSERIPLQRSVWLPEP